MITVLQVVPSLDTGGAEKTTVDVGRAIVQRGWRSIVVSEGGRLLSRLEEEGSEHIFMKVASKNPVRMIANRNALLEIIKSQSVDILHARSRAPAWSSLFASKAGAIPFVTTYHGAYNETNTFKALYNSVMTRSDRIIANSNWTARLIFSRHPNSRKRIIVIPRGTDVDQFNRNKISNQQITSLRETWGLNEKDQVILQLARITHWKGQMVLINAFAAIERDFPDTKVVLAGDHQGRTSYLNEITARIKQLGLQDKVLLTGHCSDPSAAMAIARIAVVPSIEPEAFGRAAVEAELLETPVIVSDLGAVKETVLAPPQVESYMRTGWIIPSNDPVSLADALRETLSLQPEKREAMCKRARAHCIENFSLKQMTDKTLDIYLDLVQSQ